MKTSPGPVHILGLGNLGKLFAYSLAKCNKETPITLLFHRASLVPEWDKAGRSIEITTNGVSDRQTGYDYEVLDDTTANGHGPITSLIVATKTYLTVAALRPIKHRLSKDSTLLFLQNGMGTMEEVNQSLFQSPSSRPHYLAGIVNHGVYSTGPFSAVHAGLASSTLGAVTDPTPTINTPPQDSTAPNYLAQLVLHSPVLAASLVPAPKLLRVQLQKLAVNAVINPLTVVFDCFNGRLFESAAIARLIQALLREISAVLRAVMAARGAVGVVVAFEDEVLAATVAEIGFKTARNISSMRQDVRAGRSTEIDYINGYVIARGKEFGIACPLNAKLVEMVKGKTVIGEADISKAFGIDPVAV